MDPSYLLAAVANTSFTCRKYIRRDYSKGTFASVCAASKFGIQEVERFVDTLVGSYVLALSMMLRMMVQKKNTTFTKRTLSVGLTKAILITEAGSQSFPINKNNLDSLESNDGRFQPKT